MNKTARVLLVGSLVAALVSVLWLADFPLETTTASPGVTIGIDATQTVTCGDSFDVAIYVHDVTSLRVWSLTFSYDPALLHVTNRDVRLFLATNSGSIIEGMDESHGDPPPPGGFYELLARDTSEDPAAHESGTGVLARLTLQAIAEGSVHLSLQDAVLFGYPIQSIQVDSTLGATITVEGPCAAPSPTPTSTPNPTSTPTSTPSPTPGTTTPTPPAGTVNLAASWNDTCYLGAAQQVEQAFAGIDEVLAVYRMTQNQTFDRWFPTRPDLATIATLNPFDQLFILMADEAVWANSPAGTLPDSAPLPPGWNSICYLGPGQDAATAMAGIVGDFGIVYAFMQDQSWRRFVPGRPGVSNLERLDTFASLLILVTDTNGAIWIF